MDRDQKKNFIDQMNTVFNSTAVVVVAHYSGLSVAEMTDLRRQMKENGANVKVGKNRLVKRALENSETADFSEILSGPTLLAYSDDPIAAPKIAIEFAKKNDKLVVLGGAMGATLLDTNGVKALASLPSLDELRGKLVGLILAPATKLAQLSNAPAGKLARVFSAYGQTGEAA